MFGVNNDQLLAVMTLKEPNGQILSAVENSQVRTVASETVDPIDSPYPNPLHFTEQYPMRATCTG